MIRLRGITKVYRAGDVLVPALQGIDLDIERGEFLAIIGPSGSGKSTLMHILGCLDRPTRGTYEFQDRDVARMSEAQLAKVRSRRIGFVFQSYNLLSRLPAIAQVELPLIYRGGNHRRRRALRALAEVGLQHRAQHRPTQLSGGEQQRIAIARALVTNPALILADEPTGNLDPRTAEGIHALLQELNQRLGITAVVVTHNERLAESLPRRLRLEAGRLA
jgi:ABC-type lipoprotein export system ATPase subunit